MVGYARSAAVVHGERPVGYGSSAGEQWARRPKTAQRLALRSRIVLRCAEGLPNQTVARELRITGATVCKWRERFRTARLEGLADEPRPGAPREISDAR